MYAVTSMPLVRRTRATLRRAEFGFLGVVVYTRVHTPRRCGEPLRAGVLAFVALSCRPLRTSWLMVGNLVPLLVWSMPRRRRRGSLVCPVTTPVVGCVAPGALPCTPHDSPALTAGVGRPARGGRGRFHASRRGARLLGLDLARHDDPDYRVAGGRSKSLSPGNAPRGTRAGPNRGRSGLLGLLDVEVEGRGVAEGTGQLGAPGLKRAHLEVPVGPRAR